MISIEIIKEKVKIEEVLDRYWSAPNREGRYKCVFHNGKDYNMLVKNDFAYCFVCNESADCIKLTSIIFNISIGEAIKKIDEDFRLGLGKPLTAEEKKRYAEKQRAMEVAKQRQAHLEKFECECIDKIVEKLRIADKYLLEKQFNGEVGTAEIHEYANSKDFILYEKAKERVRWLEWLWDLIAGDNCYLDQEDFCANYGTDKVEILRRVYKGEIEI